MENKLRALRKSKGLTQQKCADDLGISLRTWQRYERGQIVNVNFMMKILEYFEVGFYDLEISSKTTKR